MNIKADTTRLFMQYTAVFSLKPDVRNARTHSKTQIKQIAASIREFGFTNPILIDPDGVIFAGHGRLRAARELGLDEVPTITLEGLLEAKKRALRPADNKIAMGAGRVLDILRLELADLSAIDLDFDLALTGFSVSEIDVLLDAGGAPEEVAVPLCRARQRLDAGKSGNRSGTKA